METPNDHISQESYQGLAMEGSMGGAADKKRNKLGYHRTSVACVHCRRRKIRCLLAQEDPQGRCENCIRLKKECHFYPVDQQPPVEKRSRAGSKVEAPTPDASIVTTPTLLGSGPIMEQKDSYFPYPSMPVNATPDMATFNPGTYGAAAISSYSPDPTTSHGLGGVPPLGQPATWDTSLYEQQISNPPPSIQAIPTTGTIWDQNTPLTASISSLSAMATTNPTGLVPSNASGSNAFGIMTDGSSWNMQPSGTVPISNPEGTAPHYSAQMHTAVPSDYKAQMGNPLRLYPVPINATVPGLQPSAIPVSYGLQQQSVAYSTWNNMTGPSITTAGVAVPMAGWYGGDPVQYGHMKSEVPIVTDPLQPFDSGVSRSMPRQ